MNIFLKSAFKETPSSEGLCFQHGGMAAQAVRAPARPRKTTGRLQNGILENARGSFSTSRAVSASRAQREATSAA